MARILHKIISAAFVVLGIIVSLSTSSMSPAVMSPPVTYNNVLIHQRADPQIVRHTDGWYYFTASVPEYDRVILRRSETIQGLADAEEVAVWTRAASNAGVGYVWAPELHYIDDKWYIYFALGRAAPFDIRMFVIEGTGDNALTADWVEKGFITSDWDTFSLDATTFVVKGTRYLCWAQSDPNWQNGVGTGLMLAPMENPWSIRKPAIVITRPELPWERIGHNVNEGAYVLERNGKLFLTYSASATDHNYAMGLLTADADADLMDPTSWRKSQEPVFTSNAQTSQWGPGHSAFTVSEDGFSDLLVFHARQYKEIEGEPLNNPDRHTRIQKLYWNADGTPNFGIPVSDGETPSRLRSSANSTQYIRHNEQGVVTVEADIGSLGENLFRIVSPGLAGKDAVSIESASQPGSFLRVSGSSVEIHPYVNSTEFGFSSSFFHREGLSDPKGVSFEVGKDSGLYIASESNGLGVVNIADIKGRLDVATFYKE
ncbi:alpha-N-arabinofuranosidase [Verticillium alfalfae VaMs.102]|uniref:non-reducing end alpha-L-arabinofuranosidase n=1 Tax=Verticillium alfalfae (strain VaMs.102 / ATCC MYA-4576 / FGSC 10136) TaxID=526221 RepID=C9SNC8_VERA1|nr:alpha-N-arabinofuranosidase [Verticillium alfalfae VaMs.102]EEY20293.1 alpha-N-arabinofuranosidase [Verticillium alfalfae VaMs.102]